MSELLSCVNVTFWVRHYVPWRQLMLPVMSCLLLPSTLVHQLLSLWPQSIMPVRSTHFIKTRVSIVLSSVGMKSGSLNGEYWCRNVLISLECCSDAVCVNIPVRGSGGRPAWRQPMKTSRLKATVRTCCFQNCSLSIRQFVAHHHTLNLAYMLDFSRFPNEYCLSWEVRRRRLLYI